MSALQPVARPSQVRMICRSCRRALYTSSPLRQDNPSSQQLRQPRSQAQPSPSARNRDADNVTDILRRIQQRSGTSSRTNTARLANAATATPDRVQAATQDRRNIAYDFINSLSSNNPLDATKTLSWSRTSGSEDAVRAQQQRAQDLKYRSGSGVTMGHEEMQTQHELRRRLGRAWTEGDVYAPGDLGPKEQRKWNARQVGAAGDVFEAIGKSPLQFYRNFSVLAEFMTETGRIKHSSETGLKRKHQRKIAKTIRRAIGLSLIPSVHKHPMLNKRRMALQAW